MKASLRHCSPKVCCPSGAAVPPPLPARAPARHSSSATGILTASLQSSAMKVAERKSLVRWKAKVDGARLRWA